MPERASKSKRFPRLTSVRSDGVDTFGKVRIYVRLMDQQTGATVAGNISRSMTTRGKVSEVADAIERLLFLRAGQ